MIGWISGLKVLRVEVGRPHVLGAGLALGQTVFDAPEGDHNLLAKSRPNEMALTMLAGVTSEQLIEGSFGREGWLEDLRIMRLGLGWVAGSNDIGRRDKLEALLGECRRKVVKYQEEILTVAQVLLRRRSLDGLQMASVARAARSTRKR